TAYVEAVTTSPAAVVPFAADHLSGPEARYIGVNLQNLADEFMPDGHRHSDRLLSPVVPFVDMRIRATDARAVHLDQNNVDADGGLRHFLQPQTRLRLALHQGFSHSILHSPACPR